ncbi:MAG: Single-stranded DNA-binding protein [Planctomycetota bacterium]|jgi:single-strand DNA-binding protein
MAAFNKVILLGNLTRDPEVRYTTGGTAVCDITLAINHTYTDKRSNERKEDVSFIDVTLWGRTAEIAGEYLAKGRPVLVEGRLQQDKWDDKETGQKRSKLKVVADSMQLLGGRGEGGAPGQNGPGRGNAGRPSAVSEGYASAEPSRSPDQTFYDDMPGGTDDVPF